MIISMKLQPLSTRSVVYECWQMCSRAAREKTKLSCHHQLIEAHSRITIFDDSLFPPRLVLMFQQIPVIHFYGYFSYFTDFMTRPKPTGVVKCVAHSLERDLMIHIAEM